MLTDIPNMKTEHANAETMEMEDHSDAIQNDLLNDFEKRKKASQILITTDDKEIKEILRSLGEPICIFGEDPADRRVRLRDLMAEMVDNTEEARIVIAKVLGKDERRPAPVETEEDLTTWYHEGSPLLLRTRRWIARYSLPRAAKRIAAAQATRENVAKSEKEARVHELSKKVRNLSIEYSQIGDDRPISCCQFSRDAKMLATSSWSGLCKLWSVPSCELVRTLRGHNVHASSITFNPRDDLSPSSPVCLASCSQDSVVCLWSMESEEPAAHLEGHKPHRVSRLRYHPSGKYLVTCVYDHSWRLWELDGLREVLHQEGHSAPVYDCCFHPDGSLMVSASLDSYARVWDLRTGRCVLFFEGHLHEVLAVDVSPNGYHVVTGGEDNTCRVWDLRMRHCIYTIPAHKSLVSRVMFQPGNGDYIISSSYDCTAKLWANPNWTPLKTLAGHERRIMGLDVAADGSYIATCSFDRTFKLWQPSV